MPPLTLPFSTVETIIEEKNEIAAMVMTEKILKSPGETVPVVRVNGSPLTRCVAPERLEIKLSITTIRLYASEKSRGLITTTMTEMNMT